MFARALKQQTRSFHSTIRAMGVEIKSLSPGKVIDA